MYEPLERRRLLSADSIAPSEVEPDQPIIDYTSDVVIAAGRQQIYPPLAPAVWVDESVGSFEEPEVITVAFFPADPVDEAPVEEEASAIAPPTADASVVAPRVVARLNSIAREVLGAEDDASSVD